MEESAGAQEKSGDPETILAVGNTVGRPKGGGAACHQRPHPRSTSRCGGYLWPSWALQPLRPVWHVWRPRGGDRRMQMHQHGGWRGPPCAPVRPNRRKQQQRQLGQRERATAASDTGAGNGGGTPRTTVHTAHRVSGRISTACWQRAIRIGMEWLQVGTTSELNRRAKRQDGS